MRFFQSPLGSTELATTILFATSLFSSPTSAALQFPEAPQSNLDLSQLGKVAFVGDFNGVSLFKYTQQSQSTFRSNGSQSLLSRFPTGAFATLQNSDAMIQSMCAFQEGGKLTGVLIGGNFTSLGGVESPGIALFNPDTSKVQAIKGLKGQVNALYCDNANGTAYVGGSFAAYNNSNAIAYTSSGFKQLPFFGLNGAVTSITKASSGNIVFGGAFDGLGNTTTPAIRNSQRIPLNSGTFSAGPSTQQADLASPSNIICKDPNTDGPGNAWLLADGTPGAVTATFDFGFNPTLLRLRNTAYQGRGTKTWRFTAIPINGIMNFTYMDDSGSQQYCQSECPLPQNTDSRDFTLVNSVGMTGFRLDISGWYGAGGGLSSVELYQEDIYTFAINKFNEPQCDGVANPARADTAGNWTTLPATSTGPSYLSTQIQGPVGANTSNIVFFPDLKQTGNYSITLFTPGCLQDASCGTRGKVTVTGNVGSAGGTSFQTEIVQTNFYDKYDQIFLGHADATGSFKPSITLAPSSGQNGPLTVVAQRIRFELVSTSGGLNGLFEFNPNQRTVDMNFRKSTVDSAATSLDGGAVVNSVISQNGLLWVGGKFGSGNYNNFFSIGSNAANPAGRGLNGAVRTIYANGNILYLGGSFTGTKDTGGAQGLSALAAYNTAGNSWAPLGAGVRGNVSYIVPFQLNLAGNKTADLALAISGKFDQLVGFSGGDAISVSNFAVWVPSKSNWLQNLNTSTISIDGLLTTTADVPNNPPMFGGSVSSFDVSSPGAVQLANSNLEALPLQLPFASIRTTNSSNINTTGIITGLFYEQNKKNLIVVGGHFAATATNGSTLYNLVVIDAANNNKVSGVAAGLASDSTVLAVGISGNNLFAGGSLSGNAHGNPFEGLFVYDVQSNDIASSQPPALLGNDVTVNAIVADPNSQSVYIGGNFLSAGNLPCPGLCVYDVSRNQWSRPGGTLDGTVSSLSWADETHLIVAGNLTVNGATTSVALYDSKSGTFQPAANDNAPQGTITALSAGSSNGSAAWVAGNSQDGTAFLSKYDGFKWNSVSGLGAGTIIRDIQIFTLTSKHADTPLLDRSYALALFGNIAIPNYGNASAALFNGTAFSPFLLTNTANKIPGTINSVFVSNSINFFKAGRKCYYVTVLSSFLMLISLVRSSCCWVYSSHRSRSRIGSRLPHHRGRHHRFSDTAPSRRLRSGTFACGERQPAPHSTRGAARWRHVAARPTGW